MGVLVCLCGYAWMWVLVCWCGCVRVWTWVCLCGYRYGVLPCVSVGVGVDKGMLV